MYILLRTPGKIGCTFNWVTSKNKVIIIINIIIIVITVQYYKYHLQKITQLPYFFGYKTKFISFQNNPKDLDQS